MAIVNTLSNSNRRRDKMVNNRNGFTFAANITILTIALIVFSTMSDPINEFRVMTFGGLALGIGTSTFYMCSISEVKLQKLAEEYDEKYKEAIGEKTYALGHTTEEG